MMDATETRIESSRCQMLFYFLLRSYMYYCTSKLPLLFINKLTYDVRIQCNACRYYSEDYAPRCFHLTTVFCINLYKGCWFFLTNLSDLQNVDITLCVLFRPKEEKLPWIYANVGVDYNERVLPSITTEVLKAVVVRVCVHMLCSCMCVCTCLYMHTCTHVQLQLYFT